ncbi:hypothetical protein [Lewinella sp. LCG006]|uniref:hypothetical protein n=1 Tax=Lewinella sp. LCG006 TaxID=3231911 RepID=UPI00345F3AB7
MNKMIVLLLLFCGQLQAQSLFQDAKLLAKASSVLADSTSSQDARAQALGELTAILWFYNDDRRSPTMVPDVAQVLKSYQDNNTINTLLGGLPQLSSEADGVFQQSFQATLASLEAGPRKQILQLLYAEQATDPAEYLSLLKTMREYQEPPLDAIAALQAPAQAKQEGGSGGVGLFNEAAIIRGLFSFLVERAGEELVVTFLDRLLGKEMPTVAKLFPTVITLYSNTDYAYSDSFLASLRDAFLQDLQLLDIRLPELLLTDDLFAELQADPVFYSILTVYSVVAITKEGNVPIEETVPLVSRNLYKRYQDTEKQRNLLLADNAEDTPEYQAVTTAVQAVIDQCQAIYADIEVAETDMNERALNFAFDPDIPGDLRMQLAKSSQLSEANAKRFSSVFKAPDKGGYDLAFIPSLLDGKLPSSLVATMGTLQSYDKYFSEPVSPQNRRAAGLALTRRLAGEEFGTATLDQYFREWRDKLVAYDNSLQEAELAAKTAGDLLSERQGNLQMAQLTLESTLQTAINQWQSLLSGDEAGALQVLENIVNNLTVTMPGNTDTEFQQLLNQEGTLAAVKERLIALHTRIESRTGAAALAPDPIANYLNSNIKTKELQSIEDKCGQLGSDLETLRKALQTLDNRYAKNLSRSHENTQPLLQMGEVLSHLFYLLRSDAPDSTAQHFIDIRQLQSLLLDAPQRSAFLGLMEQSLGKIDRIGTFSRDGLSFLVQSTVQDLNLLPTRVNEVPDSLKFYQESAFVIKTLNRLLETPLLIDPLQPDSVYALAQKWGGLAQVPEISQNVLDLVFYISTKNYRQAIDKTLETTIRLTEEFSTTLPDGSQGKQHGLVHFLQQYGGFIGGMVDADSASQVQALLNAFADPPGSSRVKRQLPFTAGLNAYVGGLYGQETLSGNAQAAETTFNTLAPTMPVGVTFSFLLGKKYAAYRPSFSLFFSVIDLGSLATFNLSEDLAGDSQLTFRNILKPGFQLQWNIPKSPFYLGTGYQFGPHYREFDGELLEQRSWRYFVSFGIDIVIKRLY